MVVDQPYDFIPLRYVIEWDALAFGRGTGWFATVLAPRRTDELEDRVHRPTRDRELEDELLAENAVLSRISCAARDRARSAQEEDVKHVTLLTGSLCHKSV